MTPGPQLDALLDERLFHMPVRWGPEPYPTLPLPEGPRPERPYRKGDGPDGVHYDWAPVPRYSSDIAAAWRVVEEMRRAYRMDTPDNYQVYARFFNSPYHRGGSDLLFLPAHEVAYRISMAAAEALGLDLRGAP